MLWCLPLRGRKKEACVPGGRGEIEGGRGGWLEDDPMRGVLKAG